MVNLVSLPPWLPFLECLLASPQASQRHQATKHRFQVAENKRNEHARLIFEYIFLGRKNYQAIRLMLQYVCVNESKAIQALS